MHSTHFTYTKNIYTWLHKHTHISLCPLLYHFLLLHTVICLLFVTHTFCLLHFKVHTSGHSGLCKQPQTHMQTHDFSLSHTHTQICRHTCVHSKYGEMIALNIETLWLKDGSFQFHYMVFTNYTDFIHPLKGANTSNSFKWIICPSAILHYGK